GPPRVTVICMPTPCSGRLRATPTTAICPLSLHDALPIWLNVVRCEGFAKSRWPVGRVADIRRSMPTSSTATACTGIERPFSAAGDDETPGRREAAGGRRGEGATPSPLPVLGDEGAGVEVALRVDRAQQPDHRVDARDRDVLLQPRGVVGADAVVVGQRAAAVDERLLDGALDDVVLLEEVAVGVGREAEREVQARTRVIAVRQVAHDVPLDADLLEGRVGRLDRAMVDLAQPLPRRRG